MIVNFARGGPVWKRLSSCEDCRVTFNKAVAHFCAQWEEFTDYVKDRTDAQCFVLIEIRENRHRQESNACSKTGF
jgi:hypothetical protein